MVGARGKIELMQSNFIFVSADLFSALGVYSSNVPFVYVRRWRCLLSVNNTLTFKNNSPDIFLMLSLQWNWANDMFSQAELAGLCVQVSTAR